MLITDINLFYDTTIIIWSNEVTIIRKDTNTLLSESHMDHNGANFKST